MGVTRLPEYDARPVVRAQSEKRGRFRRDLVGAAITNRGRNRGRIEKSQGRDGKKMGNGQWAAPGTIIPFGGKNWAAPGLSAS